MRARVILSGLLVFVFVTEATAQNRFRWRPGVILKGLADTVEDVAREIDRSITTEPAVRGDEGQDYPAQIVQRQRVRASRQATRAVSIDDVIKMVHRGLGEPTIIQYIGDNGVQQQLNVNDLIRLHEEGVSEGIINAMQTAKVSEAEADPALMPTKLKSHRHRSSLRLQQPARQTVDIERFGPSVLMPPQNADFQTP